MRKPKIKPLVLTLLLAIVLLALPFAAKASTGYILINTTSPPSDVGQEVPAGGNVNLYFGGVTWSGGQFYLLMSRDGYSQVSTGDIRYTPVFDVSNLTATAVSVYKDPNYPGVWLVGNKWVNGTIKKDVAGGNYFIKAFDGTATSVAVTDTYIKIIGAFEVKPASGTAGRSIELKAYALPPNALVNLSYYNPITAKWVVIANLVAANELGQITYSMSAPDLKQAMPAGENPVESNTITFKAVVNATGVSYMADYTEYKRGLVRVGNVFAGAGNLFGNNTDLSATVSVPVNGSLRIVGSWFYPGEVSFLWNGVTSVGATTANATGYFNTTITVPVVGVGKHSVVIRDTNVAFNISISVATTLVLTPKKGPVGTVVTAKGYGFPASTTTVKYNVTVTWTGYTTKDVAWGITDSSGMFTATFTVPNDYGGDHTVTGTANDTGLTSANATFTVTPRLSVSPSTFKNDGSLVKVIGDGLTIRDDWTGSRITYIVNIDNQFMGVAQGDWRNFGGAATNETGNLIFEIVAAGFRPGLHVVALYGSSRGSYVHGDITSYSPEAYALFTVTAEGDYVGDLLLDINSTVVDIKDGMATISTALGTITTSLTSLGAKIDKVDGTLATISTSIGTITTTLNNIGAKVTEISGTTATIKTDLGTLTGKVTSVSGDVATIKTDLGTVKMDVSDVKNTVPGISIPIWIAVILSLIAAIASIYAVITIRRKIAG